jgi:hypothetical protein
MVEIKLVMRAIGNELEFMNMAKLKQKLRSARSSLKSLDRIHATTPDVSVMMIKLSGTT